MFPEAHSTEPHSPSLDHSGTPSPQWTPPRTPIPSCPPATDPTRLVIEVASQRLRASSYAALRNLTTEVFEQTLIIRGTVPSYYLKQVAQALLGELVVQGVVARIENRVDVDQR